MSAGVGIGHAWHENLFKRQGMGVLGWAEVDYRKVWLGAWGISGDIGTERACSGG